MSPPPNYLTTKTETMEAIKVMLESNFNTLFVIEGFEEKSISEDTLHKYVKAHFQYLYGKENVEIIPIEKDFIVKCGDSEFRLTWSWVTSYKLKQIQP